MDSFRKTGSRKTGSRKKALALMLQGTGSDVGKSVLVAGLCRCARRRGLRVAPFKPQNMSNNAAICADGGEIGRAQALQARAAGVKPHTDFNPVLLKPQSDVMAQIIVHGKVHSSAEAGDYMSGRGFFLAPVMESFNRLVENYDLVLVEGAGSPAEVNLRAGDIANMGFAQAAQVPVCLVGDIERGGVIAALIGHQQVLQNDTSYGGGGEGSGDADLIKGFLVNKFRGRLSLFDEGVAIIEKTTGWACYGVIPWLSCVSRLPAEDAVSLVSPLKKTSSSRLKIVAPMLSRMANFDDADPLRLDAGVDFHFIPPGQPLPLDADVVILFGTKSTRGDMDFLKQQGWHHDIHAHYRRGGHVLGLCGGYQMLGCGITDKDGLDGAAGTVEGLGLLQVDTFMHSQKTTRQVMAHHTASHKPIRAYEIHMGHTQGADTARAFAQLENGENDGAVSVDGRVSGSYLHGLFAEDDFRRAWLAAISGRNNAGTDHYENTVEAALDELADGLEAAVDVDGLLALAR